MRIICLSDGNDTTNANLSKIYEIKSLLVSNSITLDCILIGNEYDKNLKELSIKTNGYIFNPTDITYAYNIMELETMITSLQRGKMTRYTPLSESMMPPMIEPSEMKEETFCCKKFKGRATNIIKREILNIMKNPHPDIDIYISDSDIKFWKVVLSGPTSSIYEGGCWLAYVKFPESYPQMPPEIRMVTPIKHCNINNYGRICHSIFDRNYTPTTSVSTILECIYGLLLNPDVTDPLDTNLSLMYYNGNGDYEAMVMKYVRKYASKDRHAWRKELDN